MITDHCDLESYMAAVKRDERYFVEETLSRTSLETTQIVRFSDSALPGALSRRLIRKYFNTDEGIGGAYERLFRLQEQGCAFAHVPRLRDMYPVFGKEGLDGSWVAAVMDYVEGDTLESFIGSNGGSLEVAARVFPFICDAVSEIHCVPGGPVIHRDLKPSNIVIGFDPVPNAVSGKLAAGGEEEVGMHLAPRISLIDFGIARLYKDGADRDTKIFGTRSYAPPEQFGFGQTDVRSDVYALGMVLCFCLTGETPSPQLRNGGFQDAEIPDPMKAVLLRATDFSPSRRYASVVELKGAFAQACAALGVFCLKGDAAAPDSVPFSAPAPTPVPAPTPAPASLSESPLDAARFSVSFIPSMVSRAASGLRDGCRRLVRSVPRTVGIVWDALLFAVWTFFLVAAVASTVDPDPVNALHPLWFRVAEYLVFFEALATGAVFLLCDRRPLYRLFPRLEHVPYPVQVGAIALIEFVVFVSVLFVGLLYGLI